MNECGGLLLKFVMVYVFTEQERRRSLWDDSTPFLQSTGPVLLGGDFNEVLSPNET